VGVVVFSVACEGYSHVVAATAENGCMLIASGVDFSVDCEGYSDVVAATAENG